MNTQKTTPPPLLDVADTKAAAAAMENGGVAVVTVRSATSTKTDKYRQRSNVLQVAMRFVSMVSCVMAFYFMMTANEVGFAELYGFKLPIQANWSYSFSFEYLVGITIAAAAHSLLQFIIGGSKLLRRTPLISSRSQAWLIFLVDQAFAYAMLSAGSAASGVTNLNRTGIKHTPLPNFCKPLRLFCEHVAASVIFTFLGSFLLAASAIQQVIWLSKN